MKTSFMVLVGGLFAFSAHGMDRDYTMPQKEIIFAALTNGTTCFDENDHETATLATVLGGKTMELKEIESRVNGAVTRHARYLEQVLEDMEPSNGLKRCIPDWKKTVLEVVLAIAKESE